MSRGLITLQFIFCFFFVSETMHLSAIYELAWDERLYSRYGRRRARKRRRCV